MNIVVGPFSYRKPVLAGAPRQKNLVDHTSLVDWSKLSSVELWLLLRETEVLD